MDTTIRKKMINLTSALLSSVTIAFLVAGSIMTIMTSRSRFDASKKQLESTLVSKGMTLIVNNSVALRGLAEDNAYMSVRDIVKTTVDNDSDVVYGMYIDSENQPWVRATPDNPSGFIHHESMGVDSLAQWAHSLSAPGYKKQIQQKSKTAIIEFAAPVFGIENQKLGVIRYGITDAALKKLIDAEYKRTVVAGIVFGFVFVVIGFTVFFAGRSASKRQATEITRPIEALARAARAIAKGDYSSPISIDTNDEITILADNFNTMRKTVGEYTDTLEKKVAERTQELEEAQKELVDKAHKAGMADIAAGTLHNVGNILNSVKTSVQAILDVVHESPLKDLSNANRLLKENIDSLEDFILRNPKGNKLMKYYIGLEEPFMNAHTKIETNAERLMEKTNAIADVIAAQQNYAGMGGLTDNVNLALIVEDALIMQEASAQRHEIAISRDYRPTPDIPVQKTKLIHILVNLLRNAKDAMNDLSGHEKTLIVSLFEKEKAVYITIQDTGCGIDKENIKKIFTHGFTTKKDGHGFGLHSSANYMKEMGGDMWAESLGVGLGTTFYLKFPLKEKSGHPDTINA